MEYIKRQYGGDSIKLERKINLIENETIKKVFIELLETIKDNENNMNNVIKEFSKLKNKLNLLKDDMSDNKGKLLESIIESINESLKMIDKKQKDHLIDIIETQPYNELEKEGNTTKSKIYLGLESSKDEQPGY